MVDPFGRRIHGLWSWPAATCIFASRSGKRERVQLARAEVIDETTEPDTRFSPGAIHDDGSLGEQIVLHDFGWARGIDGMCWDADGNIVATAGSHRYGPGPMIYVFATNGRVLETHPTPSDMPTSCLFGGPGYDELFITYGTGQVHRVRDSGLRGRPTP